MEEESMRVVTSILSQEDDMGAGLRQNDHYSDFERASPSPIGKQNFSFKKSEAGEMDGGISSRSKTNMIG